MIVYVAYNEYGDLIAEAYDYDRLLQKVENMGYDLRRVLIGRAP